MTLHSSNHKLEKYLIEYKVFVQIKHALLSNEVILIILLTRTRQFVDCQSNHYVYFP